MWPKDAKDVTFTITQYDHSTVLFCESRLERSSVPLPFNHYEVSYENDGDPAVIRKEVDDDVFLGTLLAEHNIDCGEEEVELRPYEIDYYSGPQKTILEFAQENDIELTSRVGSSFRSIDGIEFLDEFVGDPEERCHLSVDGMHMMIDGVDEVFTKELVTDTCTYYHGVDCAIAITKNEQGGSEVFEHSDWAAEAVLSGEFEQIWERSQKQNIHFIGDLTREHLPEFAKDYDWQIKRHSAYDLIYQDVEIYGIRAIFTEESVSRNTVPKSLHFYEVGQECDHPDNLSKIAREVHINFKGTLITERPLDLGKDNAIFFEPSEISPHSDRAINLPTFAKEVGIAKPPKDHER